MTLQELIERFRADAKDCETPYLWSPELVTAWLNEAVAEAAVRGRLLLEVDRPQVCQIQVIEGQASYPLHAALYEITYLAYKVDGTREPQALTLVSTEWLDRQQPGWRHRRLDRMCWAVQGENSIRLVPAPSRDGLLVLEGYRLPLLPMRDPGESPEIHAFSHEKLVLWALHRAFSQPDADGFDPTRAAAAEAEFTRYFGRRPDSDLRRQTREDQPHVTESIIL
ncbi:hypothetical protein [Delftia acidovorans]|uniref:phage adaptor protein n=1 Tax=Delftia acidovorans TaxID=80866 RepID=UPI001EDE9FA4|nr:hypothetical protein [Delftia acidovorans]MCG3783326.1 hypothetical protein [Delftia acidovorans]